MLTYAIVLTLNGNYILKPIDKVRYSDDVEIELYGDSVEDIKAQYKAHLKQLESVMMKEFDDENMGNFSSY